MSGEKPYNHHIISGLKNAYFTSESPFKKEPKLKGSPAKGKTYERTILRKLKSLLDEKMIHYNRWIRFEDASGWHYAQPDIFIETPHKIYLIEIKRTQCRDAELQLRFLYAPLLKKLFPEKKVLMIEVCKNLKWAPENEIDSLLEARDENIIYTYHCIGEIFNIFKGEFEGWLN